MHYTVHYQVLSCTQTESAGESAEWALPEDYQSGMHTLAPVNYTHFWGLPLAYHRLGGSNTYA